MGGEEIVGAVVGLFLIGIFLTTVIPSLGQATGSDTTWMTLLFVLLGIGVALGLFKGG